MKLSLFAKFFPTISFAIPWSGEILKKGRPRVILIALKPNNVLKVVII